MKKYDSYKNSGVDWIGEIPSHWDCKRLKHLVESPLKYGANEAAESDDPSQPRYIRITDFGQNGVLRDDTFKSLSEDLANEYLLEEGDILFARSGATVGKTFLFQNYQGKACFAGYLIRCRFSKNEVDSRFINYYTFSNFYENWKQSIFQQATIQNIGADKYNQLLISTPPITEQITIANFLDHKTAQIDDLIAKKERLIQLLEEERTAIINQAVTKGLDPNVPMKDSGIEWLGEIPEHWVVKKLRFLADIIPSGIDKKSKEEEEEVLLCNYVDVYKNDFIRPNMEFMKATASDAQIEKLTLRKYDVIATKDSEDPNDIGVPALVLDDMNGIVCGYHLTLFRAFDNNDFGRFLFWFLKSKMCSQYLSTLARGITRYALGSNAFKNLTISLPLTKAEINEIANYLDSKTKEIETIKSNTKQEIELLNEYKTALISEVVTGKVDVRNEKLS